MPGKLGRGKRWATRVTTAAMAVACVGVIAATPASAAPSQLKPGDTGESVECLQKGLNLYYSDWTTRFRPLEPDGVFGGETTAKVNVFKGEHGLSQNGIFGAGAGDLLILDSWHMTQYDKYGYVAAWRTNCIPHIPHS
ncbi:hypothetical protein GCM10010517_77290 [Streptosporangium fragile]|uniref:Peptidoglycan binding-like domain-containing protein n=1 Tax=Streptosporangium fragile TaxID=46186 RepID=A0ABN3WCS8_9ACTN